MNIKSLAALLVLAGCAGATNAPPTVANHPPPNAQGEYALDWPQLGRGEARYITIQLGPDTFEHCRDVSPKFDFDSSLTYVQDRAQLAAFARCMNKAGMENRNVLLIGRADPRGTDAYNMELGEKRAEKIKNLLIAAGVAPDRIKVQSQGERDAKGTLPEYSYGFDRRVDVVVGGVHAP
jgi:peptidoglycan-associated lipoprotein